MGIPVRGVAMLVLLGAAMFGPTSVGLAKAQQSTGLPGSTHPSMAGPDSSNSKDPLANTPDPLASIQQAQRTKAIQNERQKRIVDDTAKLLQLATELKEAVDKTTKDQLSLEVIRKADEIEKLAHDVKSRMRS